MFRAAFLSLILFMSTTVFAQISERDLRAISNKIIEESIINAKLTLDHGKALKSHLENLMLNNDVVRLLHELILENNVTTPADAERVGFEIMSELRDRALQTLSNDDINNLMILNFNLLSKMSDYECSQYIKKLRTDDGNLGRNIFQIAGQMDIDSFRKYLGYYDKAIVNMLSQEDASERLNSSQLSIVRDQFIKDISENKIIGVFFSSGKSFATGSNKDICTVGKEIIGLLISGDPESSKMKTSAFLHGQLW